MTNVDDLDDITPSYPVIVEYTRRHVVWVEASSPAAAAEYLKNERYEYTDDQSTLATFWSEVAEPDRWDWGDIYGRYLDGPYSNRQDAHVELHKAEMRRQKRAADRAACAAAGHPDTGTPIWDGRIWCKGCVTHLDPAPTGGDV